MIIFGGVDGFSQLPVSLECFGNNKSETLLSCFMKGVQTNAVPSRVRSDKGKENVLIADFMIANQGPEPGSMICGKKTRNLHRARLWRDVYNKAYMEDEEILDPFNNFDLEPILHVFESY